MHYPIYVPSANRVKRQQSPWIIVFDFFEEHKLSI